MDGELIAACSFIVGLSVEKGRACLVCSVAPLMLDGFSTFKSCLCLAKKYAFAISALTSILIKNASEVDVGVFSFSGSVQQLAQSEICRNPLCDLDVSHVCLRWIW